MKLHPLQAYQGFTAETQNWMAEYVHIYIYGDIIYYIHVYIYNYMYMVYIYIYRWLERTLFCGPIGPLESHFSVMGQGFVPKKIHQDGYCSRNTYDIIMIIHFKWGYPIFTPNYVRNCASIGNTWSGLSSRCRQEVGERLALCELGSTDSNDLSWVLLGFSPILIPCKER